VTGRRTPRGVPAGGEFAESVHDEATGVDLCGDLAAEMKRRIAAARPENDPGLAGQPTVAELTDELRAAGGDDYMLDDLVHDLAGRAASHRYNNDLDLSDRTDDEAFDEIHDDAEAGASNINNGGFASQIAFIREQLGDEADAAIRAAVGIEPTGFDTSAVTGLPPDTYNATVDAHHFGDPLADGGPVDTLVYQIMEGGLSAGVSNKTRRAAAQAWAGTATGMAAAAQTDEERAACTEFAQGVWTSAAALTDDQIGFGDLVTDPAAGAAAIESCGRRRSSAVRRENWRLTLQLSLSEAEWRGRLVGAAALSGLDGAWGMRTDPTATVSGRPAGTAEAAQPPT
jgi:hypothetical protein